MSAELAQEIFSTPRYAARVAPVQSGERLLVVQDAHTPEARMLLDELARPGIALTFIDQAEAGDGYAARLAEVLAAAQVGLRLYVCGEESFLWQVQALARQAGLLEAEIELFRTAGSRKVYCVHCSTMQTVGPVGETVCEGCGVRLLVREHFSRRLGAYQGVCLNADDPRGEGKA